MIVVADTSGLYAAFDAGQTEHVAAAAVLERETLIVSPLVITELDHLIQRDIGFGPALDVAQALIARMEVGQYKLADLKVADLAAAHTVRLQYHDLRLDFADAVGVVLADRYKTNRIFTLDHRDFRAIAPLTPEFDAFQLLPADAV